MKKGLFAKPKIVKADEIEWTRKGRRGESMMMTLASKLKPGQAVSLKGLYRPHSARSALYVFQGRGHIGPDFMTRKSASGDIYLVRLTAEQMKPRKARKK